jgi:hypothetical protein
VETWYTWSRREDPTPSPEETNVSNPTTYLEHLELELENVTPGDFLTLEPATTIYLTGVSTAEARAAGRENLGILVQPGNSTHLDVAAGSFARFGADNGFYGLGSKADPTPEQDAAAVEKWLRWLVESIAPLGNACLFATVPDVLRWIELDGKRIPVGDAEGTLARYPRLASIVRKLGLPAALVAQDGLELDGDFLVAGSERLSWDDVDVIFVGGSDAYKLGPDARRVCEEARARGKWVHVGRVNSWKRIALVRDYADSVDGTFLGFGPRANWPRLEGWLDRLDLEAAGTPAPAAAVAA